MATEPSQFPLDMDAELAQRRNEQTQRLPTADTSMELEAQIQQQQRLQQSMADMDMNPLAHEKIQRDLNYQRQMEQLPQPDSAPLLAPETTPGLDRLEQVQRELEAAKAEASRWKKEFGRREGTKAAVFTIG